MFMPIDFFGLSKKNKELPKQAVAVMNGAVFLALDLAKDKLLKSSNILYLHVQRESLRCYVGITVMTAQMRWGTGNPYRNNPRFGNAIKKYGWDSFDSYVLAFGEDRASLEDAEKKAIAHAGGHKTRFTYNLSPGGDVVSDTGKPVFGVRLETGEEFEFKSSAEAARELGLGDPDRPATVARGLTKSTGGWWFRFADDHEAKPPVLWGNAKRTAVIRKLMAKRVIAINLKTGEERTFESTSEAGQALNMEQSAVVMVARGRILSSKDWWFKYEGSNQHPPEKYGSAVSREKRDRKVYATNLTSGEKAAFRNCTVTDLELCLHKGASAAVCSKERASAGGWWFSYNEHESPPEMFGNKLVAKARSKSVIAINLETLEERVFESAKEAGEALGMCRSAISQVIAGKKRASKGYVFKFRD